MERVITFCVFIFHLGLVASFPFAYPEGYNIAYGEPQPQYQHYQSFAHPQPVYGQQPQYNSAVRASAQALAGNAYDKAYQQLPSAVQNTPFVNGQQTQNYHNVLASTSHSSQQTQEQLAAQINEQQAKDAIQRLLLNKLPPGNEPAWTQAQATAGVQQQHTAQSPDMVNPYAQIYKHVVQRPQQNYDPQFLQRWKHRFQTPKATKKKPYLVIYPDGRTEYVDKIDIVKQNYPNYVLVNAPKIQPISPPSSVKQEPMLTVPNQQQNPTSDLQLQPRDTPKKPQSSQIKPEPYFQQPQAQSTLDGQTEHQSQPIKPPSNPTLQNPLASLILDTTFTQSEQKPSIVQPPKPTTVALADVNLTPTAEKPINKNLPGSQSLQKSAQTPAEIKYLIPAPSNPNNDAVALADVNPPPAAEKPTNNSLPGSQSLQKSAPTPAEIKDLIPAPSNPNNDAVALADVNPPPAAEKPTNNSLPGTQSLQKSATTPAEIKDLIPAPSNPNNDAVALANVNPPPAAEKPANNLQKSAATPAEIKDSIPAPSDPNNDAIAEGSVNPPETQDTPSDSKPSPSEVNSPAQSGQHHPRDETQPQSLPRKHQQEPPNSVPDNQPHIKPSISSNEPKPVLSEPENQSLSQSAVPNNQPQPETFEPNDQSQPKTTVPNNQPESQSSNQEKSIQPQSSDPKEQPEPQSSNLEDPTQPQDQKQTQSPNSVDESEPNHADEDGERPLQPAKPSDQPKSDSPDDQPQPQSSKQEKPANTHNDPQPPKPISSDSDEQPADIPESQPQITPSDNSSLDEGAPSKPNPSQSLGKLVIIDNTGLKSRDLPSVDSMILSTLLGDSPYALIQFFLVKPERTIETEVTRVQFGDHHILEEITQSDKYDDGEPVVTRESRLLKVPQLE